MRGMKAKTSTTLMSEEAASACSGILVMPTLRKIAASKLYSRIDGMPSR